MERNQKDFEMGMFSELIILMPSADNRNLFISHANVANGLVSWNFGSHNTVLNTEL
jgi:hypothetical protein